MALIYISYKFPNWVLIQRCFINDSFLLFYSYLNLEDEMQISRMPIPADDCANNEMSVDPSNPPDAKSDLDTSTKVNGDSHKKLNGSVVDDNSKEAHIASEVVVRKEEDIKAFNSTESLSDNPDELVKNGTPDKQVYEENIEETNEEEVPIVNNDKPKDDDKPEDSNITIDNQDKDEEVKPMEIDQIEDITVKEECEVEPIKKELEEVEELVAVETQETEKLNNGESILTDKAIKNEERETNPINGDARLSDEEKSIKSEKVYQKVPEEEDVCSEISADTLSPKQVPNIK